MRSFNHTLLSFLLSLSLIGGATAAAQTTKKDAQKSGGKAQTLKKDEKTTKKDSATAKKDEKNSKENSKTSKKDQKTTAKKDSKSSSQATQKVEPTAKKKNVETVAKNTKPKTETTEKNSKPKTETAVAEKAPSEDEKAAFEAVQTLTNPFERIGKLKEFLTKYPRSALKLRAQESLVAARAEYGDELMRTGDPLGGKEQFKLALKETPAAMSDKLFADVVSRIPANLFFRGEQAAALEIAKKVEEKAGDNPERLIALAQFYLMIENSEDARRLASRAAELKSDSPTPQITLGLANRIGFRLEAASQAFESALKLDPKSVAAKRGLADSLRGLGQSEDAARIYREILQENPNDEAARSGLVLALFGAGNRTEAETEMTAALEQNPKNYQLLATAAYWYAANKEAAKAVELGRKAVEIEPRYTWAHIALARGLLNEGKPLEAERALLIAKQYGNFPTLDYELATARAAAGFYEEAVADLRKNFQFKNGLLETKLAGRIKQEAPNFIELLALERRASILQPASADTEDGAEQMKKLLAFADALNSAKKDETEIAKTAQEFVAGNDGASVHRKLYAANRLLKENVALPQVLEFAQAATEGVDAGAQIPAASAAVLAEELYEPRQLAAAHGNIVNVPEIGRGVLTNILRGRIEEIAGWSLYNQDRTEEAVVRLKRAVGILPEKSAWWRSSQWRLGAALEKAGKGREALDSYAKSYRSAAPDQNRRAIIEALYVRTYGSSRGLDIKLGEVATAQAPGSNVLPVTQTSATMKNPLPEIIAEINPPQTRPAPTSQPPQVETQPETKTVEAEKKVADAPQTETATAQQPEVKETVEPSTSNSPEAVKTEPQPDAPKTETKSETAKVEEKKPEKSEVKSEIKPEVRPETAKADEPTLETGKKETPVESLPTEEKPESKTEKAENNAVPDDSAAKPKEVKEETKNQSENAGKLSESKPETPSPMRVLLIDNLKNTVTEIPVAKTEKTETAKSEPVRSEPPETNPNVKITSTLEMPGKPATRPRLACVIWLNQTEVSVLSGGGVASLLVGIEGDGESVENLVATSENPSDIEIKLNKDVQISGNRALYEIRSISENKGDFTIVFQSTCGKKSVKVRAR
ncbi:MAG TPA: tetratricopeptide repeat protein [Pyrinomonadaceae bacterium]|jgi:Flp pilus assembly protein TadD